MGSHTPPLDHGAERHTDVTRELILIATSGFITATPANINNYGVLNFPDGQAKSVWFSFKIPDGFVSFSKIEAIWSSPAASGNLRWAVKATYAAAGEAKDTHSDAPSVGETATAGAGKLNVQEPKNTITLSNIATGDYVGLKFVRDAVSALDTLNTFVYLYCLVFTYTANQ